MIRGGGVNVLRQSDSSSLRSKLSKFSSSIRRGMMSSSSSSLKTVTDDETTKMTDNVSVVKTIPLSRIRSVNDSENTWSKVEGDDNDSVLSIKYGAALSENIESIRVSCWPSFFSMEELKRPPWRRLARSRASRPRRQMR